MRLDVDICICAYEAINGSFVCGLTLPVLGNIKSLPIPQNMSWYVTPAAAAARTSFRRGFGGNQTIVRQLNIDPVTGVVVPCYT